MYSSGTAGIGTSGPGTVTLITLPVSSAMYNHLIVSNAGTHDGFVSVDGGINWVYVPAATASKIGVAECWQASNSNPLLKRNTIDMTGVYAEAEWVRI
ncbi:MAG TPA: hypothetical protein VK797_03130 [Tepidisphaeraceae bacterium]|jgi:hypothetical protein|nr:hypothetical protein [Tepidisphaeraceae bacterium]